MKPTTIGPMIAACVAGASVAGCLHAPGRHVQLTAAHTPSAPVSKIDLYYAGAVRAIEARDYARALDYLQTGRAIAPDDVRVINAFGVVYDKLGRFDLSARYYAEAKTLDPTSKVVDNNLAYSERLQGLAHEPLAFASAAEAEARLKPHDGLMPGAPVVVAQIDYGTPAIVMVDTVKPAETAPELFGTARRMQMAAASRAAVKPAGAAVSRVAVAEGQAAAAPVPPRPAARAQVADAGPAHPAPAAKPVPAKAPAKAQVKAQARLAGAPVLLVDASGSPDAARRLGQRLTRLGWSVQAAPAAAVRPVDASHIDYAARTPQIAQALARTLPGAVRVHACAGACPAIRLVVGRDARAWDQPKKIASRS
jgi:tetratricopeptide (TPR) repeat protein